MYVEGTGGIEQYRLKTIQGCYVPLRGAKVALITVPTGEYTKKALWTLILYEGVVGNIMKNMPSSL